MNKFSLKISTSFLIVSAFILFLASCVPIRKQLVLTDKAKYSLKEKQKLDTIVNVTPYEYKVRNGDILSVEIVSITPGEYNMANIAKSGGDVQSGYLVNDSGYVDVPVIGLVKVGGQSVEQARNKIKIIASDYLNNVTVNVRLLSFTVDIFGEVSGHVTSPDGKLSIIQAIAQVGGTNQGVNTFSNLEKVKIIRQVDDGRRIHVFYVDISDVQIINRPEYFLMPKDILVLEPHRAKNGLKYQQILAAITATFSAVILFVTFKDRLKL